MIGVRSTLAYNGRERHAFVSKFEIRKFRQLACVPTNWAFYVDLPVSSMTTAEKLAAMEQLWASLQMDAESAAPPEWHGRVLAERQKRIDSGETSFSTLEEVRKRLEDREK